MAAQIHRLFFALQPDAQVGAAIARVAAALAASDTLRGRWIAPPKYHLTLHFLGDQAQATAPLARAAAAAAQVRCAAFAFTLDRLATFSRQRAPPCVLCSDAASDAPLHALADALSRALCASGFETSAEPRFTPHVTIAYVQAQLAQPIAIAPIVWRVQDFVLFESRAGQYHELARWKLA